MFGSSPNNSQNQSHPSCRTQIHNLDSMPSQLDLLYKPPVENYDAADGEPHSTTTTPLNYMRRSTPTSQPHHLPAVPTKDYHHDSLQQLSEDYIESSSSALDDLRYSASVDDFPAPEKRGPSLENEQAGDATSDATAEPLQYAFQPDNLRNAPSASASTRGSTVDDLDLSVMSLHSSGSTLDPTAKKYPEPLSYQQPRQGENPHLEFLQSGRELAPPQDPRLRQHLQSLQQQQQSSLHQPLPPQQQQLQQPQQHQQAPYAPLPRTNSAYRPGNTSGYSIGEQREMLGLPVPPAISFPPHQPTAPHYAPQQGYSSGVQSLQNSRRTTPNSTPTHASSYATAQQTPLPIVPGAGSRYSAPQPAYSGYEPRGGPPADEFSGDLSGMAARAMSSSDPFGDVEGLANGRMPLPYAAHAPAQQRSPTHLQQMQHQQQPGYATSPKYGAGPHGGGAPMGAPYGQPPAPYQPGYQGGYQAGYQNMGAPSGMGMGQELIYVVQFKRGTRSFTLSSRVNFAVNERDFVVVEADRGEDIGIVIEIITMHAFLERRMNMPRPSPQQGAEPQDDQNVCCILRLATLHERQQLPDKFHTEKDIVQSCNELAMYGFGLPIVVFDAELQFDRRKLTIYYDCNVRIDFRDFVRQLYSTYKARIWMKKVSPHVQPDVQPFAAMALATGVQFSQSAGMGMGMGGAPGGY